METLKQEIIKCQHITTRRGFFGASYSVFGTIIKWSHS